MDTDRKENGAWFWHNTHFTIEYLILWNYKGSILLSLQSTAKLLLPSQEVDWGQGIYESLMF